MTEQYERLLSPRGVFPVQDKARGASANAAATKGSAGKRYNEPPSGEYTDGGYGGKRTQRCIHVTWVTRALRKPSSTVTN